MSCAIQELMKRAAIGEDVVGKPVVCEVCGQGIFAESGGSNYIFVRTIGPNQTVREANSCVEGLSGTESTVEEVSFQVDDICIYGKESLIKNGMITEEGTVNVQE